MKERIGAGCQSCYNQRMKILHYAGFILLLLVCTAHGARRSNWLGYPSRLGFGIRYHREHSVIERWPYAKGDLSYGLNYAVYDGMGYFELGLDFTPDGVEIMDDKVSRVWTPRINLAMLDKMFVAGIGIANSYIEFDGGGHEWSGLLYQFHLGLEIPLGDSFSLDGGAYYTFKRWGELSDFDVDDLEYAIRIGYRF